MKKQKQGGFTLAELLIVVAIIAVLVAILIPILAGQLERSRESASLANLRAVYADAMAEVVNAAAEDDSGTVYSSYYEVRITQTGTWEHVDPGTLPFMFNETQQSNTTNGDSNVDNPFSTAGIYTLRFAVADETTDANGVVHQRVWVYKHPSLWYRSK